MKNILVYCKLLIITIILLQPIKSFSLVGYVGEIRMFAGSIPPAGWKICDGQILPISYYNVLYSVIGITYGSYGTDYFRLPDLRGRVIIGDGVNGGDFFELGSYNGSTNVTLSTINLPEHSHQVRIPCITEPGNSNLPDNSIFAVTNDPDKEYSDEISTNSYRQTPSGFAGNNLPVNNMQKYAVINYIICYDGKFPTTY